ncbi:MAG: alpha-amylase, partial [Firmicutes bacterium]|nr:alpha-amylase [Bacillota bacterium]
MSLITSIEEIDLTPVRGKKYFNIEREWREEFIYFLMVDRFHDDEDREPVLSEDRLGGIRTHNSFYGGNIKGVIKNLEYIARLGCTSIWLSPIFKTSDYHGYAILDYLDIDERFGTKEDLIELVEAAHSFELDGEPWPMKIILDVV